VVGMPDDQQRAWAVRKDSTDGKSPFEAAEGPGIWLRDVTSQDALPRFVLLDTDRRIASPDECIACYGDLLKRPADYWMVLDGDDQNLYEIVDWPMDFRKSVRRLVYCVTLMRVPLKG